MSVLTKQCTKCRQILPLTEFSKQKRVKKDGLRSICKKCVSIYNKNWFQTHRQIRNTQKLRDEQNHPDRRYARFTAWKKVPIGSKCVKCGSTENLHRHHPDYSRPLEVVTLCQKCHLGRKFGKGAP